MSCLEAPWGRGEYEHSLTQLSLLLFSSLPVQRAAVSRCSREGQGCVISVNHYLSITPPTNGRFFAGSLHSKDQGIPGQLWMYDPDTSECKVVDEGPFTVSYGAHQIGVKFTQSV
ncbi:hypothetical protein J3R83DRAFT_6652 [Lanmaoa asiatica]|nr:hypothetical protein J3R83DRAFT_6652 [Lanmaoa asiatica]